MSQGMGPNQDLAKIGPADDMGDMHSHMDDAGAHQAPNQDMDRIKIWDQMTCQLIYLHHPMILTTVEVV